MDYKPIWMVVCQKLAKLLSGPFRRWMAGRVDMQNPAGTDLHRNEDVDYAKSRGDGNKEIAGNDCFGMILDKCRPTLIS